MWTTSERQKDGLNDVTLCGGHPRDKIKNIYTSSHCIIWSRYDDKLEVGTLKYNETGIDNFLILQGERVNL